MKEKTMNYKRYQGLVDQYNIAEVLEKGKINYMSGKEGSKVGCEYKTKEGKASVEVDLALFIKEIENKRSEKEEEGYLKRSIRYLGGEVPIIRRWKPVFERYLEQVDTDKKVYKFLQEGSVKLVKEYYTRSIVEQKDLGKFDYFINTIKGTSVYQSSLEAISDKFTRKVGKYLISRQEDGKFRVQAKYMRPYENLAKQAKKGKFSSDVLHNAKIELLLEGINAYPKEVEQYVEKLKEMKWFSGTGTGYVSQKNMQGILNYMSSEQGRILEKQDYKQLKNISSLLKLFSEDQKGKLLTEISAYKLAVSTIGMIMDKNYLTDRSTKGKAVPIESRSDTRFESLKHIGELISAYGKSGKNIQEGVISLLSGIIRNEKEEDTIKVMINNLHTVASEYANYGNIFNAILKKQLSYALGKEKYKSNYHNQLFKELGKSRYLKRYKINRNKKKNKIHLDNKVINNMEHIMMYNRKEVLSGGMGYLFDYSAHDVIMYRNGVSRCIRSTLGYIGSGLSRFDTGVAQDRTIKLTADEVANNIVRALGRGKLSKEEVHRVHDYISTDVLDGVQGRLDEKIVSYSTKLFKKGSEKSRYLLRNLSLLGEENKKMGAIYKKHSLKSFKKLYTKLAQGYSDFEDLNKVGDEMNTFLGYSGSKMMREFKEYLGVKIMAGTIHKNVYYNISTLSGSNSRLEYIKSSGINTYIKEKYRKEVLEDLEREADQYQKNILLNRQIDSMINFNFF